MSDGITLPAVIILGDYNIGIILTPLIIVVGAIVTYFIVRHILGKMSRSLGLEKGEMKGIYSITKLVIIVVAIMTLIFQFSTMSGVVATAISVAAGTVIGFASRNTISNAIAGILLLSSKPFKIGDRIRTTEDENLVGDVIEITILYTKIKTIRSELVTIPNQTLLQRQIVNYSGLDLLAIIIDVSVNYGNDRIKVESLLIDSAKRINGIVRIPNPCTLIKDFGNYAAVYELRAFTNKPNEYQRIQSEVRKEIYDTFQKHGLSLIVPQAQINLDKEAGFMEENQA